MKLFINALVLLCVMTLLTFAADDISLKITRAEIACAVDGAGTLAPDTIQFVFDQSLKADELMACNSDDPECKDKRSKLQEWLDGLYNPGSYHIVEINSGNQGVLAEKDRTDEILDNTVVLKIRPMSHNAKGLKLDDLALVAKTVAYGKVAPFLIKVEPNSTCEQPAEKLPKSEQDKKVEDALEAEKDRNFDDYFTKPAIEESPALKVDFSLQGAKREQMIYFFDVEFRPYTSKWLGWGGHYELNYFFLDTEYRINAKKGDKKNVLNFGALDFKWTIPFRDSRDRNINTLRRYFPAVTLSVTPLIETEWGFREMKALLAPRATSHINLYQSRGTTLQLNPFVGFEFGPTLRSEEKKTLALRPLVGASLTANFLRKEDKPLIGIEVGFIHRMLLRPELSYGLDADGEPVPDRRSMLPRTHYEARVDFNVSKYFSPFLEYEYGRVPPKYTLLNSTFKTGVTINVDLAWKSFK